MSLSEDVAKLSVPQNTGAAAAIFSADTTLGAVAAAFHVTLPPPGMTLAERGKFLQAWQNAAQYVVSRLYAPDEVVDEDQVIAEYQKLKASFEEVAISVREALSGNVFQTVYRLLTGKLPRAFELSSESLRATVLYVYSSAAAASSVHTLPLADAMSEEQREKDFLSRVGAFQSVVTLARSGLLDPIARPARATSGLALGLGPAGVIIVVVVIVSAAALIGYLVSSIYATSSNNQTVLDLQARACERDPSHCGQVTIDLSKKLAFGPDGPGTVVDQVKTYALVVGLGLVAIWALPKVLRSWGGNRSEA